MNALHVDETVMMKRFKTPSPRTICTTSVKKTTQEAKIKQTTIDIGKQDFKSIFHLAKGFMVSNDTTGKLAAKTTHMQHHTRMEETIADYLSRTRMRTQGKTMFGAANKRDRKDTTPGIR